MTAVSEREIQRRGITRLCHFTKSSKLLHIMSSESGIVANSFLVEAQSELLEQNDPNRFDGRLDYISCSVQYPNTWYLNRVREIDPIFRQWVVLFLEPKIMLDARTLYCHRNAAADRGMHLRPGLEGFLGMFSQTVEGQQRWTRTRQMPDCCPTDAQAEIMIYRNISRSDIIGVAVPTESQALDEIVRLQFIQGVPEVQFIVAPDLFNNRWHRQVRQGLLPNETLVSRR